MYQPRQFAVDDTAALHETMRAYPLGSLITFQDGELVARPPTPQEIHYQAINHQLFNFLFNY